MHFLVKVSKLCEGYELDKVVIIGNLTSIAKILICIIAPMVAVYLGTDENTVEALLVAIVGLLFGLVDAKFPNTIFNGESDE